jgi:hypothetical protein
VAVRPTSGPWAAAFHPASAAAFHPEEERRQEREEPHPEGETAAFRQRHPEAYLEASFHRHLEAFHQGAFRGASPGPFPEEAAACWQ